MSYTARRFLSRKNELVTTKIEIIIGPPGFKENDGNAIECCPPSDPKKLTKTYKKEIEQVS